MGTFLEAYVKQQKDEADLAFISTLPSPERKQVLLLKKQVYTMSLQRDMATLQRDLEEIEETRQVKLSRVTKKRKPIEHLQQSEEEEDDDDNDYLEDITKKLY
jgi:hypothetical protein